MQIDLVYQSGKLLWNWHVYISFSKRPSFIFWDKIYPTNAIALKNALNESRYRERIVFNTYKKKLKKFELYCTYSEESSSALFVSFKEHQFISINRTEAYTFPDFIASYGGLLDYVWECHCLVSSNWYITSL